MAVARKNQLLGLDIGSHAIKLAEIHHSRRGRILVSLGLIGLPPAAIVEGVIREMEVVANAIRTLARQLAVRNRKVAFSVSGYPVLLKRIEINAQDEVDLEAVINERAEQYIPFPLEEVNLDFDIAARHEPSLDTSGQAFGGHLEVMLAAARKNVIEDYVSAVHQAGLSAAVVDVDLLALQNACETGAGGTAGCYALLQVGAEELGISVIRNGVPLFSRESSFGGNQITEAIMKLFDLSFEKAEKMKLGGLRPERDEERLQAVFRARVGEWIREVKQALDFVAGNYPQEIIERILVSGGSSRLPGFRELLEKETGIPAKPLDPFAGLLISEKQFDRAYLDYMAPQAAVAVGLAMRSLGDK